MMNDSDIAGDGIGDGIGDGNGRGPDGAVVDPSRGDSSDSSFSRTVRIFISSTFRDFQEERDLLVRRVFPELRRRARERGVEVVDVDLRWGITESQAERGETLSICLQEIDRCRPYFIGLLGDRYGWQPAADRYPPALIEQQTWLREHLGGTSVTELEILHGVLNAPGMTGLAFFYLRDPAWSANRGADFASESADGKARLSRLKDRLRGSGFPVFDGYPSPQAVADRILEDLWQKIDARFPASEVPDEHEQERRRHESFARTRRTLYVGGEQAVSGLLGRLDAASDETDPAARRSRIVVVAGESGCGKSALLANAIARLRAARPQDLVFEHYLGSAADAGNADSIARRLCREVIRRERIAWGEAPNAAGEESGMGGRGRMQGLGGSVGLGESLGEGLGAGATEEKVQRDRDGLAVDSQRLFEELPEYLARGAALAKGRGGRFVVVLDALDKLSSGTDAAWLPQWVPSGVRLVLSTLEGGPLQMARQREWPIETASRLTAQSARQLVVESLERFNKRLDDSLLDAIAAHPLATLPIFLRVLTDELRVFGSHEELASRLRGSLACSTVEELYRDVLVRIEGDLLREGGSSEDLAKVLTALWASRRGMSEAEVVEFAGVPRVTWSRISLALDESLFEQSGRWIFSHDYLRRAVAARYLPEESQQREQHASLARWWDGKVREGLGAEIVDGEAAAAAATDADEAESDAPGREPADDALVARAIDELPWQWAQAQSWDDLATCLLDAVTGPEIVMRIDDQQIFRWWQTLGDQRGLKAEVEYERSWEGWRVRSWRSTDRLAEQLSGTLADAGLASAFQRRLMEGVVAVRRRRATRLGTPESQRDLLASLVRLGDIVESCSDLAEAESLFAEGLKLARELADAARTAESNFELSWLFIRLGHITQWRGDLATAESLLAQSVEIAREFAAFVGTRESRQSLSVALVALATCCESRGDLSTARSLFAESLENFRDLAAWIGTPESLRDLAVSLLLVGSFEQLNGDAAKAELLAVEAMQLARELVDALGTPASRQIMSVAVNQLAAISVCQGDVARSEALITQSIGIARERADRLQTPGSLRDLSDSLNQGALIAVLCDDLVRAESLFAESLEIDRRLATVLALPESRRDVSSSLRRLGDLMVIEGDLARAEAIFAQSLTLDREHASSVGGPERWRDVASSLNKLGSIAESRGELFKAESLFAESLEIARDLAARFGTPGELNDWVWSAQKCASVMMKQSCSADARATLAECRGAAEAISDVSDAEILDTVAAWWERWCEVHEAMGDQSIAADARARAAALRDRIAAMNAASGDGDSGGVSEGAS